MCGNNISTPPSSFLLENIDYDKTNVFSADFTMDFIVYIQDFSRASLDVSVTGLENVSPSGYKYYLIGFSLPASSEPDLLVSRTH